MGWDCSVIGLTGAGVPDAAFGSGGIVTQLSPSGRSLFCSSLAVQPDGRILLGGMDGDAKGYVGRLLANGAIDPEFRCGRGAWSIQVRVRPGCRRGRFDLRDGQ